MAGKAGKKLVGVLALQGSFARHAQMLTGCGAQARLVKNPADLNGLQGLVLPGGESTTMSKLLLRWQLLEPLQELIANGCPTFGTCAGLILLAQTLVDTADLPRPQNLAISVRRNAYGRQIDSFEAKLLLRGALANAAPYPGIFIRAPQIEEISPEVEILADFAGAPVLVRQGNTLAASFHPELTADPRLHQWFLDDFVGNFSWRQVVSATQKF